MLDHFQGWAGKLWEGALYLCGMPPAVSRNWLEQNATTINLLKWVVVIAVGGYMLIVRQDEKFKAHVDQNTLRFQQEREIAKLEKDELVKQDTELRRVQLDVLAKLQELQIDQQKLQLEIIRMHPNAGKEPLH